MPHNSEYYPDYEELYPGIEKRLDILRVLRASDRKMRYMEQQLQTNRFMEDQVNFCPAGKLPWKSWRMKSTNNFPLHLLIQRKNFCALK